MYTAYNLRYVCDVVVVLLLLHGEGGGGHDGMCGGGGNGDEDSGIDWLVNDDLGKQDLENVCTTIWYPQVTIIRAGICNVVSVSH